MQNARLACCPSVRVTCACWAPLAATGNNVTLMRLPNVSFDLQPSRSHLTTWCLLAGEAVKPKVCLG